MRLTTPLTAAFLSLNAGLAGAAVPAATHSGHPAGAAIASQEAADRGYLGIQMTVEDGAMVVRDVRPGSPAASVGLHAGDRITRIAGQDVGDGDSLTEHLAGLRAGSTVSIVVERDGWQREFEVELASRDAVGLEPGPSASSGQEDEAAEDEGSLDLFRRRWSDRSDAEDAEPRFRFKVQTGDGDETYELEDMSELGEQIRAQVERELGKHRQLGLERQGGTALRMPRVERAELDALREELHELRREVAELRGLREELGKLKGLRQEVQELVRSLRQD